MFFSLLPLSKFFWSEQTVSWYRPFCDEVKNKLWNQRKLSIKNVMLYYLLGLKAGVYTPEFEWNFKRFKEGIEDGTPTES